MFFILSAIGIATMEAMLLISLYLMVEFEFDFRINLVAIFLGILGAVAGFSLFGKFRVFYHEFKHKLVSSLVGNKTKKLVVKNEHEGLFEYEYTDETKKYNPLIAVAPYFFPFITIFLSPFWTFTDKISPELKEGILVFCLLFDFASNMNEIHAYQSDFEKVPGGKLLAKFFVLNFNSFLLTFASIMCIFGFNWFYYMIELISRLSSSFNFSL